MPQLRQYTEVTTSQPTDGLWLDRLYVGTEWIQLLNLLSLLVGTPSYANDAAAAVGGVAVGQIYRNGSTVCVRMA